MQPCILQLVELAGKRVAKEGNRRCADWGAICAAIEGKTGLGLLANTVEETEAKLVEIVRLEQVSSIHPEFTVPMGD